MRAVILAAGAGRELQPLTAKVPASMVPVIDRPLLAHTAGLLERQGIDQIIAVVRDNARAVTEFFGGRLDYRVESRALGSAGAVTLCADALDGTFLVVSGSVLSDLDLERLLEAHRAHGAIATICAARVEDATGMGVVRTDGDARVLGIEEGAAGGPALVNAAIYAFEPAILERIASGRSVDWALDVFPDLIAQGVPFYVHELDEDDYWRSVRTPDDLQRAIFDLLEGLVDLPIDGEPLENGLILGEGTRLDGIAMIEPPVWIGDGVHIGEHVRLQGPLVIGHEATIGDGAQLRGSVIMPGSVVPRETVLIGAIAGHARASPFVRAV